MNPLRFGDCWTDCKGQTLVAYACICTLHQQTVLMVVGRQSAAYIGKFYLRLDGGLHTGSMLTFGIRLYRLDTTTQGV